MVRDRKTILVITAVLAIVQLALRPVPPLIAVVLIAAGLVVALLARAGRAGALLAGVRSAAGRGRSAEARAESADDVLRERHLRAAPRALRPSTLAGLLIVIAALAFLEMRDPYYFTQDDNFAMGPVAIAAGRGFLHGEFPTWNPYQLLGQPTSVQSIYALTYPPMVLFFALAHLLGREQLYIELFTLAHLFGAYFTMHWAARSLRVRPVLAAAAAVSFVLSGGALMIARSYATMAPLLFWAPLLVVLAERFRRGGARLRWALATAAVIGIFCPSGNGQMWLYAVMFFGLAVLLDVACGGAPPRALAWLAIAAAFSLAIALPLIVPQMWFMQTVAREGGGGHGIYGYLEATLLPAPLAAAAHPEGWGNSREMTPYYYAGTVLTACAMVGMLLLAGSAIALRGARAVVRENVWLVCAAVALWMSFGPDAGLWTALSKLPVFDKFTGPWKLVVYFHLFAALGGALVAERWMSLARKPRTIAASVAAVTIALTLYNVTLARSAFYNYAEDPYPPLPRAMRELIGNDRILPIAAERSLQPGYVSSLALDFPSWYGIASFDGYDPFVQGTGTYREARRLVETRGVAAARAYGLRWIVEHRTAWERPPLIPGRQRVFTEVLSDDRRAMAGQLIPRAKLRLASRDVRLYELEGTDPLAFSGERPLPLQLRQDGVTVGVTGAAGEVVVNFLNVRGMRARIDGRPAEIRADRWNRMVVSVPAGSRALDIRYRGPWNVAFLAAAGALLAGALAAAVMRRNEAR